MRKWLHCSTKIGMLLAAAILPSLALLEHDGFLPPSSIPYAITSSETSKIKQAILWIDARPEDAFRQEHIPGALNLNRANWNKALPEFFKAYVPRMAVVVYCSSECSESSEIASRIRRLGLNPVLVLEGGFESWKASHFDE